MVEDWNDYRFFLNIAEHGTLKSAAEAMKVNLSTVLRRINALEEKIGARLFERSHDGFSLTEAGNIMKRYAEEMQASAYQMTRKVQDADHSQGGVIKLTTSDSVFHGWLGPLIQEFRQQYPDIYFEFIITPRNRDLARHEADVAIAVGNNRPDYMVGRKIMDVKYRYYGLASVYAKRIPMKEVDLQKCSVLFLNDDFAGQPFMHWCKKHISQNALTDSGDNFTSIHKMIQLNLGIGILPHYWGDADVTLTPLFTLPKEAEKELWMLSHPDLRHVNRIKSFMGFIRKYAAA